MWQHFVEIFTFRLWWCEELPLDIAILCGIVWLLIFFLVFLVFLLVNAIKEESDIKTINEESVMAVIAKKEHIKSSTNVIIVNRMPILLTIPEEYNVYLEYGEVSTIVDDEELFTQVKAHDNVSACLKTRFDKKGRIVKQWLELAPLN